MIHKYLHLNFIKLFFLFQNINFIISIIDNIIRLGDENFRFIHFSSNENGDMIVDTSKYPDNEDSNERRFFGLRKNGTFYFKDKNNKDTPFLSLFCKSKNRIQSESSFIQFSSNNETLKEKECIFSISIGAHNTEIYDLEREDSNYGSYLLYLRRYTYSERFSFFKSAYKSETNNNCYIISMTINEANVGASFHLWRAYFVSLSLGDNFNKYEFDVKIDTTTNKYIVSCFETAEYRIICLYQDINYYLTIYIHPQCNGEGTRESILYNKTKMEEDSKIFFKGIHFKEEIGIFIYYINSNSNYPIICFKKYDENSGMKNYSWFGEISLETNYHNFNPGISLNDIVKMSDIRICLASASSDKEKLYLVLLTLFDNDTRMMINYFVINMFSNYHHKIYQDLRLFLYNEYISFGFNHCSNTNCEEDSDMHYSSLIIFNYPNVTDKYLYNIDLIEKLSENNYDLNKFSFNLSNNFAIENNIFGYEISNIKINNISGELKYKIDDKIIEVNDFVSNFADVKLSLIENIYSAKNYSIEYSPIAKSPKMLQYIENSDYTRFINFDSDYADHEEEYFTQHEYSGRNIYYNIILKDEIISNCDDNCSFCLGNDNYICIECKEEYYFDEKEKKCLSKIQTTIPNLITTTIPSLMTTLPKVGTTIPIIMPPTTVIETTFMQPKTSIQIPETLTTTFSQPKITIISHSITIPQQQSTLPIIHTTIPPPETTVPLIKTTAFDTTIPVKQTTIPSPPSKTTIVQKTTVISPKTTNIKTTIPYQKATLLLRKTTNIDTTNPIQKTSNILPKTTILDTSIPILQTTISSPKTSILDTTYPVQQTTIISPKTSILDTTIPIEQSSLPSKSTIIDTTIPIQHSTISFQKSTLIGSINPTKQTTIIFPKTTIIDTTIPITTIVSPKATIINTTIPITNVKSLKTSIIDTTIPNQNTTVISIKTSNIDTTIPIQNTTFITPKTTFPFQNTTIIETAFPIQQTSVISPKTSNIDTNNPIHNITVISPKTTFLIGDTTTSVQDTTFLSSTLNTSTISLPETTIPIIKTSLSLPRINSSLLISEPITKKVESTILSKESIASDVSSSLNITEIPISKEICSNNNILENNCSQKINENQTADIYDILKEEILSGKYNQTKNNIIKTKNVIFQVSTIEEQQNNEDQKASSIEFDECEKIIREKYNISNQYKLIMLKLDILSDDLSSRYVQYEIYDPITLRHIPLDICENVSIIINTPNNLTEYTESLYKSLNKSGYNLFDINDPFYKDFCTPYTTENGTDITLLDRQNLFYENNKDNFLCQSDCMFLYYNETSKKSKCSCNVKKNDILTQILNLKFKKEIFVDKFLLGSLKNANFKIMKCYKLVFSIEGLSHNIGSYILSSLILILITCMILSFLTGKKNISIYIKTALQQTFLNSFRRINTKRPKPKKFKNRQKIDKKGNRNNITQRREIINKNDAFKNNLIQKDKEIKKNVSKINEEKNRQKKLQNKEINNILDKTQNLISQINKIKKDYPSPPKRSSELADSSMKNSRSNILSISYLNNDEKLNNYFKKESKSKVIRRQSNLSVLNIRVHLNDEEMNSLCYRDALILDKRTYFQYYYSLLKKKHLILFIFLPSNDYNLIYIKLSLFLLAFSLYFTINAFFFTDDTMHKITEDHGDFNLIYQIPKILYSTLASAVINMILKRLSLSETHILSIKQEKNLHKAKIKALEIQNCLKKQFIIFFILCLLFMLFFWYFISSFCAVYRNTQIILIKSTVISFGLSMIYPFGLNLIPGIFRIPALRAENKDKDCLYKFSQIISYI